MGAGNERFLPPIHQGADSLFQPRRKRGWDGESLVRPCVLRRDGKQTASPRSRAVVVCSIVLIGEDKCNRRCAGGLEDPFASSRSLHS